MTDNNELLQGYTDNWLSEWFLQTKHEYESREIRRQRLNREREATVLPDEDDNNQSDSDNSDNDNGNENDNVQYSNRSTSVNGGPALTKMTSKSAHLSESIQLVEECHQVQFPIHTEYPWKWEFDSVSKW